MNVHPPITGVALEHPLTDVPCFFVVVLVVTGSSVVVWGRKVLSEKVYTYIIIDEIVLKYIQNVSLYFYVSYMPTSNALTFLLAFSEQII